MTVSIIHADGRRLRSLLFVVEISVERCTCCRTAAETESFVVNSGGEQSVVTTTPTIRRDALLPSFDLATGMSRHTAEREVHVDDGDGDGGRGRA